MERLLTPIDIDALIPVVILRVWCKDSVVLIWTPYRGYDTFPIDPIHTVLCSYN